MNLSIEDDVPGPSPEPPKPVNAPLATLNQSELALKYKISRNSVIEKLDQAGIHPIQKGGKGGTRYEITPELEEALELDYIKSDRKREAQERKLEAEAELKELDIAERRGEIVAVNLVELAAVTLFRTMYLRLIAYCDDSALDISRMKTRGEVAAYQKEKIGVLLQELRTNPNNFLTANLETE
jgi:hypothetical protein